MTLRTVTYKINMDLTGVKNGNRSMQLTLKSMEQDAGKAKVSMEQLAKTIGDKYGVKTKVAVDTTRSVKAELRDAAREANRTERNFQALTREYQHMAQRAGQASDRQEVMNAMFRLGTGATLSQKKELVGLVREYQRLRTEATKTQGSMRALRGQASNVGFQLQDIAVQAQMGTNALVILGQQGSQLAAGFGATGALVGAFIAVGAAVANVLVPNLMKGKDELKELTEAMRENAKEYGLTKEQAEFLSNVENKTIDEKKKLIKKLTEERDELGKGVQTYEEYERQLKDAAVAASGLGSRQSGINPIAGQTILSQKEWNEEQKRSQERAVELTSHIQTLGTQIDESKEKIQAYSASIGQGTDEQKKWETSNNQIINGLTEQSRTLGLVGSQIAVLNKRRDLEILSSQNATDAEKEKVAAAYDAIIAHEIASEVAAIRLKAEKDVNDEVNKSAQAEKKRLAVMAKYSDSGRLELLQKQYVEELRMAAGNDEAILNIHAHYARERTKINGTVWEQYAIEAQDALMSTDEIMLQSLDRMVSGFGNAMTQMIFDAKSPKDALKDLFEAGTRSMVQFFSEWAAQKLLIWALDKTIGSTTQATAAGAMSANTGAKVAEAGLNAFTATAAIPIVGPLLAPGAAAAAIATAATMAATATTLSAAAVGVYDKGGRIPAGGAGIVAEIGDELVGGTMVYNGSPNSLGVTGREQTARQVGSGGFNLGGVTINSNGNASPEAIGRAVVRAIERKSKRLDKAIFDSMDRGRTNRGQRFNA